jgi:hypothetical protein
MNPPQITEVESIDKQRLQSLEQIIESNLTAFYQVGISLAEIRNKKLYKLQGYHNFNNYCKDRWDIGSRHAYRQMESSGVMDNLRTNGSQFLPTSERQVRPLTKLNPTQQCEVWNKIIEIVPVKHGTGKPKITTALVEIVVSEFIGQKSKLPGEKVVYKVPVDRDTDNSLNDSLKRICHLLPKPEKKISKEIMIEALLQVALQEFSNKEQESLVAKVLNRLLN